MADGGMMIAVGVLTPGAATTLSSHPLWSKEFWLDHTTIILAVVAAAFVTLKVFTARELSTAFDFNKYVDKRIAPAYADEITRAIREGNYTEIEDLSSAVRNARTRRGKQ